MKSSPGSPKPLGITFQEDGLNFALFSKKATEVTLCLFTFSKELYLEFPLYGPENGVWHIKLTPAPKNLLYAIRIGDTFLSDPYAKSCLCAPSWGIREPRLPLLGRLDPIPSFDWQNVSSPSIPLSDLIIYEMHVRGFTMHPSSGVKYPGTYLGVIEKIPYLKNLGINAVELMPVFEFDETHCFCVNPETHQPLLNYWGYDPINFFLPMRRYAVEDPITEFKMLVRELHRAGIEVILDVVYGHTPENKDYKVSFRGIDKPSYYLVNSKGLDRNYSGCGNTFQANGSAGLDVILSSLRYWVQEMHVDGFRFDLASILTRGIDGRPLTDPPLLREIVHDPILSKTKLIAEPWDASGLYQISQFPKPFLTWNDRYRDHVRKFIKGTNQEAGPFATALCGSEPLYPSPLSSLNFITAHDGYTLNDLVSYQSKHNLANGENNRDGMNTNYSWNCGVEGPSQDPSIRSLRERQQRNFFLALMISQGIPLVLMGDEVGHTRKGNNNPYNQDNEINYLNWGDAPSFLSSLIAFRLAHPVLRRSSFLTSAEVEWHGTKPFYPDWSADSRFVAFTLYPLYIAFNANYQSAIVSLPPGAWHLVLKTDESQHYLDHPEQGPILPKEIELPPYSALLIKQKKDFFK